MRTLDPSKQRLPRNQALDAASNYGKIEMQTKQKISIQIDDGDALNYRVDVLAVKYAQAYYGLDKAIIRRLEEVELDTKSLRPRPGQFEIIGSHGQAMATNILFYGVVPLHNFRYQQIREFSFCVLEALSNISPNVVHLGITLHGANYGLDEIEALESEIAGLVDAISEDKFPKDLRQITVIEQNSSRAQRLKKTLDELLPNGHIFAGDSDSVNSQGDSKYRLRAAGYSSDSKSHVFVAMPFDESMDDVYYYGISRAVRSAGYLCERVDETAFTGDVLDRIKQRIKSALLVVADLSTANPNVYLELGYAWGCGIPTVIVVRDTEELMFDVQGQKCLSYKRIQDLENILSKELTDVVNWKST